MAEAVLQCLGGARTVTGSRHLVHYAGRKTMLDCGLFQGHRQESIERNRHLPILPDAVVLSHAHIDHSGALPAIVKDGFRGPIHATAATRDLCAAMLADSAMLAANDARHLNRRRAAGERPIEPIYDEADVERAMSLFVTHPYGEAFEVSRGQRATFREAGHILGSAGILLELDGGPTVYFTGDLGRRAYPILKDPEPLPDADVVLSECTYGMRDHEPLEEAEGVLRAVFARAAEEGGRVLVPAFSVGRTQNLIYACERLRRAGALPSLEVFVDSPLAAKATEAFERHPDCHDKEVRAFVRAGGDPFTPEGVRFLSSVEESKALNDRRGPFVVIAGSGMCEGGRIVHHLAHGLEDPRNTVLMVGWSAPDTLGRRLLDGEKRVRVLGQWREVKAQVARIGALSAHAGRSELLAFLAPARERRSEIHLVHGDEATALAFADALREAGHERVGVPEAYATYPLAPRLARGRARAG
jgi:metallo-beta-lactamase family protein